MALDAATLALTAAELKATLTDAKIAKIFEPTRDELVITCLLYTSLVYTYIGLVLFLTGANVGFMPAGNYLGQVLTGGGMRWVIIPIGMVWKRTEYNPTTGYIRSEVFSEKLCPN